MIVMIRQFKLVCSELNERFTSNEYMQTVGSIVNT